MPEDLDPQRPVRLEDIAARIGVSRSEVSRVLNGRQRTGRNVGRAKQEEILRVARELNYQPHRAAQILARGRTDTVALMLEIPPTRQLSPHYQEIIGALTVTLNEFDLHLLLYQVSAGHDPVEALERLVRERSCDGIVLTDLQADDPRPDLLEKMGQPFVLRGSAPRPGLIAVGMNNVAVGRMAIETFADLGHRRILFHNIGRSFLSGHLRWEGCEAAARERGLLATLRYEDTLYREEDMYELTRQLMQEAAPPTAIFAADELAAFGVLRALGSLDLKVPGDVSVLTCLNARFMRRVNPTLSMINVRQDEVATQAGRLTAQLLRGEPVERRQFYLDPLLEVHDSLGPPPGK